MVRVATIGIAILIYCDAFEGIVLPVGTFAMILPSSVAMQTMPGDVGIAHRNNCGLVEDIEQIVLVNIDSDS